MLLEEQETMCSCLIVLILLLYKRNSITIIHVLYERILVIAYSVQFL